MKLKIDHIGYVVKNIKETKEYFKKIYKFKGLTNYIYEKAHGVNITFIDLGNKSTPALELIEPTSKKSKVYNFLHQKGGGMHHLAYEVDNLEKAIKYFIKNDFLQISPVVPGAGHNLTKTCWLLGKKKELIELLEKQKQKKSISRFTKRI
jgi:methylmalonyl-CoA/ethylmalonyl-CoA epimerase